MLEAVVQTLIILFKQMISFVSLTQDFSTVKKPNTGALKLTLHFLVKRNLNFLFL